jgi:hypothetical protein
MLLKWKKRDEGARMNNDVTRSRPSLTWYLLTIFVVAAAVNYVWEVAQAFLYVGMEYDRAMLMHCLIASLGDGIILWVIYIVGLCVFKARDWFVDPTASHYAVMLLTGLVISIVVEWVALDILNRWAYTSQMPIIPVLKIGLAPVLQMLILPPVIFAIVAALQKRKYS